MVTVQFTSLFIAVPQQGTLMITTEFGKMEVKPNEICIIQVTVLSPSFILLFFFHSVGFSPFSPGSCDCCQFIQMNYNKLIY